MGAAARSPASRRGSAPPAGQKPAATARGTIPAWSKSARTGFSGSCCVSPDAHLSSGKSQSHRYPLRPEGFLEELEAPGDRPSALLAPAIFGDAIVEDAVPVASDHGAAAARAVSRSALREIGRASCRERV